MAGWMIWPAVDCTNSPSVVFLPPENVDLVNRAPLLEAFGYNLPG